MNQRPVFIRITDIHDTLHLIPTWQITRMWEAGGMTTIFVNETIHSNYSRECEYKLHTKDTVYALASAIMSVNNGNYF